MENTYYKVYKIINSKLSLSAARSHSETQYFYKERDRMLGLNKNNDGVVATVISDNLCDIKKYKLMGVYKNYDDALSKKEYGEFQSSAYTYDFEVGDITLNDLHQIFEDEFSKVDVDAKLKKVLEDKWYEIKNVSEKTR